MRTDRLGRRRGSRMSAAGPEPERAVRVLVVLEDREKRWPIQDCPSQAS